LRRLNRRGISPVIATIIIVAVAIAIAIAVAFWVVGIAGLFTRFEKLELCGLIIVVCLLFVLVLGLCL